MTREFEEKVVYQPKSFKETIDGLVSTFNEYAFLKSNNGEANVLRDHRGEIARKMILEAGAAYDRKQPDAAWFYLTEAAEAIGYLVASKGAVYPREDEHGLHETLAKNGKKGGMQKGVNAKALQDKITTMLIASALNEGLKNKADLRRKYNLVTAEMDGYQDADRKWSQLLKRDDIQALLKQSKK